MSLIKTLLQHKRNKISLFTTPSHAQELPFRSKLGKQYYAIDYSEIDGLDNLNNPEGCIAELEKELSKIYFSGYTHILTNGSTQGMLALMLATLKKDDKVIIASNCHKSVHNGLILTGAVPIWAEPHYDKNFGVYTQVSAKTIEEAIKAYPDAKCLILTNPTYDGAITDIAKISALCKEHNIILIVDEAHGGLWNFDKSIEIPAIHLGADASVQSLHKTCGAVNPVAVVHLSKESKISKEALIDALNLISTTSPSYPALVNAEETINYLASKKGKDAIQKLIDNVSKAKRKIAELDNFEIYQRNSDITKIFIRPLRMTAEEASDILYDKFKIECEIQHKYALTFLCGIGTQKTKLKKLVKALKYLNNYSGEKPLIEAQSDLPPKKIMKKSPQHAFNAEHEEILLENAENEICAEIITSYPPGIPVLTYGELITKEHINYLNDEIKIRIVK